MVFFDEVARRTLTDFNFEIEEGYDGQQCLDKVKVGNEYDLILMVIMMPNMSGETAIARLKENEKIDNLLYNGYSTMSLGYIGIYEMTKLLKGISHTTVEGHDFAIKVMNYLKQTINNWKKETNIDFTLYGTPSNSLCYKFAKIDKENFGTIKDITDKGYYTNSYHIDYREKIDVFDKLLFESEFQSLSCGGSLSFININEIPNDIPFLEKVIRFIYDNIQYVQFTNNQNKF